MGTEIEPTARLRLAERVMKTATLHGEFTLRSGAVSHVYFDKYLLESDPGLLRAIAEGMTELMPDDVDALAGLEMGGIPLVTLLSQMTGLPAFFVRKQAKDYGTCRLAEGGDVAGKRLLVVEDVVTSGGQILLSVADLRALGATVESVLCIIDREAGGVENLAREGLTLRPLFRRSELEQTAGGRDNG